MSLRVDISSTGMGSSQRFLRGITKNVKDFRPWFRGVMKDYHKTQREQTSRSGAVDGLTRHRPLTRTYRRAKSREAPARPILVRSGDMQRAIENPRVQMRAQSLSVTIMSDIAIYHQKGTSKMAQRPILRITENLRQQERWLQLLLKHLEP